MTGTDQTLIGNIDGKPNNVRNEQLQNFVDSRPGIDRYPDFFRLSQRLAFHHGINQILTPGLQQVGNTMRQQAIHRRQSKPVQ